jgi:beta-lactamase regulating signal transducer with metallopeptidase domain
MIGPWMAYALLVGALAAVAARGLESALRLVGRPVRWVWAAALALSVLLVTLAPQRVAPPVQVRVAASQPLTMDAPVPTRVRQPAPGWRSLPADAAGALRRLLADSASVPDSVEPWLAGAWGASSLLALLLLAATQMRIARLRRGWPLAELDGEAVRLSPSTGPAVVGLRRPEIVAPRWLLELAPGERRLVLVHEREHVLARDPLLLAAGCAAAALLPWHPASWWMLARLRLAVELDCDARVLRRGLDRRSYGTLLIDLAGRSTGSRFALAALADEPTHLERRLLAMTSQRTRYAAARGLALGCVSLLALFVACEAKLPTAADVARLDVAGAEALTRHVTASTGEVIYYVDGKEVIEAVARRVDPDAISSMDIKSAPGQSVVVSVKSRQAREETKAEAAADLASGIGDAVVLIDGKRADLAAFRALNPADIEALTVIKDRLKAIAQFGPAAANGLVLVTTKSRPRSRVGGSGMVRVDGRPLSRAEIDGILNGQGALSTIYLIDGARATRPAVNALPEDQVWSLMVAHDPALVALYGVEAEKGVVQVKTKTGSAQQYQRFVRISKGEPDEGLR